MNRLLSPLFALLVTCLLAAPALASPSSPVAGEDYEVIEGGTPFAPVAGTVEVAEIFGYTCPHCATFEPSIAAWKRMLPAGVRVVPVPAPFGGAWIPYARAYFAAQALGVADRTHAAMFRALHEQGSLPLSRPEPAEIAAFYVGHGVPAAKFMAAYRAPSVDARLEAARDFIARSGVDGTPALVVAGRYRVRGRTSEDVLRIARWLVDRERAAAGTR
jgi:thiol:disulfide interchange protein DsbA